MPGSMTLKDLEAAISAGTIDTVIVAFPDMQGRLIGKRFTGAFFLDSALHETHACNYLLTVDIDMEPVPGYRGRLLGKGLWRLRAEARRLDAPAHSLARGARR